MTKSEAATNAAKELLGCKGTLIAMIRGNTEESAAAVKLVAAVIFKHFEGFQYVPVIDISKMPAPDPFATSSGEIKMRRRHDDGCDHGLLHGAS